MNTATFGWDLAIALLLVLGICIAVISVRTLKHTSSMSQSVAMSCLLLISIVGTGIVAYGSFIEPQLITVTRSELPFPIDQTLKIAVISDIHAGPYTDAAFINRLVREINALLPDIIVIAGDSVLGTNLEQSTAVLAPLKNLRANLGVYAVLGNHDYGIHSGFFRLEHDEDHSEELTQFLSSIGITVLRNEYVLLPLSSIKLALAGTADLWSEKMDLSLALDSIESAIPIILIAHNPDTALLEKSKRAKLIIAGHTHGGQIRLPFIGPIFPIPTHLGQKYSQGIFSLGTERTIAITRGIGESGPRARLLAPPEILLLTLQPTLEPILLP